MSAFLPVNEVFTQPERNISSVYTVPGSNITWYRLYPFTDPNFFSSSLSHLWSKVGMYTEFNYNAANLPYEVGGQLNTALERLPSAFYQNGGAVFAISNSEYRVQLNGQNFAINIPLNSSYTGATSGLTATTLYNSFVYQPNLLQKDPNNLCTSSIVDSAISELSPEYTASFSIGNAYQEGTNPNREAEYSQFNSGVVYLVCNDINKSFSGATGSSLSWSYLYNQDNKYINGARLISFAPNNTQYTGIGGHDLIVGALFLNEAIGVIWDTDLVNAIDWPTVNGDPYSITGATFTTGQTASNVSDIDVSQNLHVNIILPSKQWDSQNPSYIAQGDSDCGIAIDTITLNDEQQNCLALVKFDTTMIKTRDQIKLIELKIPISNPITPQDNTLTWDGISPL
jgi:hypothetical protein